MARHRKTPAERCAEVGHQIPDREEIALRLDKNEVPPRYRNWNADQTMRIARRITEMRKQTKGRKQ
jgi:hypothetical protein